MSKKEKKMLGLRDGIYAHEDEMDHTTKRFFKKIGGTPVAFLDISYGENGAAGVALGTRSGKEYHNKGYAKELVNEEIKWLDTPEAKDILAELTGIPVNSAINELTKELIFGNYKP